MQEPKRDAGGQRGRPEAGSARPQSAQGESTKYEFFEQGRDDVGVRRPVTTDRLWRWPDASDFRPENLNAQPCERDEKASWEALHGSQAGCRDRVFTRATKKPD